MGRCGGAKYPKNPFMSSSLLRLMNVHTVTVDPGHHNLNSN
jgi:hypothetical protein